ncbi:MAG: sigma-70 family RNA polymerase sigma factor [Chloroflexi bacterium]|nr:sigma-70 family RNA polymerase sigma factor [Chloroflexota bacterium]
MGAPNGTLIGDSRARARPSIACAMELEALWARHRAGERDVRDLLIEAYAPLASETARRMRVPTGSLAGRDDLESAAYVGLIQAIDRYDAGRGVPFEAYAALRIRGAVVDELRLVDDMTREERRIDDEAPERGPRTLSLDSLLASGFSWISDEEPESRIEDRELRGRVDAAIRALPERQRELVTRHYRGGRTLRACATQMGISQARASQLRQRAIENIRRALDASAVTAA